MLVLRILEPTWLYVKSMAPIQRSFGDRSAISVRLPSDQYAVYDSLAEQEDLDLGPWIAKILAENQGLPIPAFVGRHARRKRRKEAQEGHSTSSAA